MYSSDYQVAKVLQEQFQNEIESEESAKRLTYKKPNKHNLNSSKCLVDPSWEVIDPTPDIHILFMSFNERFFWNKLLAVCVSWSKRMTSCAGICSYQGRGGMCSITLSEPLLKLRPRKDLVETLLHEMIHAYLFVTHNNKDRDGHGPEFHKHMYRINSESGTNITVYHDFHDEVRLYKQHWWRCKGPCQNWKPYYGFVKRAMNRAPGPTDRWWAEHSKLCGGEFIKVKEPEKPIKSSKSNNSKTSKPESTTTSLPDIRKHFSSTNSTSSSNNLNPKVSVITMSDLTPSKKDYTGPPTKAKPSSVTTIQDLTSPDKNNQTTKIGNINGFPNTPGRRLSDSSVLNNDYSSVRNHLLNKFPTKSDNVGARKNNFVTSTPMKISRNSNDSRNSSSVPNLSSIASPKSSKRVSTDTKDVPNKLPRLDVKVSDLVECPVCSEKIPNRDLNDHLDDCFTKTKECIICNKSVPQAGYQEHVTDCCSKNFDDSVTVIPSNQQFPTPSTVKFEECAVCEKPVESSAYADHIQSCLHKMYDKLEEAYAEKTSKCPVCDREVPEGELSNHLGSCKELSDVFEDEECVITRIEDENIENKCPVCSEMVLMEEMNAHIDLCLNDS